MAMLKAFINRRSVPLYFVLTFVLSWGSILSVVGPGVILGVKIYHRVGRRAIERRYGGRRDQPQTYLTTTTLSQIEYGKSLTIAR